MDSFINKKNSHRRSSEHNKRDTSSGSTFNPTFFQTVKEGIATGVGVAVGERLVNSIFGPKKVEVVHTTINCDQVKLNYLKGVETNTITDELQKSYNECLK